MPGLWFHNDIVIIIEVNASKQGKTPILKLKPATLRDVAQAAGVSLITASRALSNPAIVTAKTKERVKQAVDATGYIPNLLAGGLKSKRSLIIAGVVPVLSVTEFLPVMQAMTSTLATEGYQLILGETHYDAAREESVLNTMIGRQPDGIVVLGLVQSPRARERLRRSGLPVLELWELSDRPVDMVIGFSHLKVGSTVGGYFLSKGWKNVGAITGSDHRARLRTEGFSAAYGGNVPMAVVQPPSNLERGRRALAELLEKAPGLEAVCCTSDMLANGALTEARARGLRVPEDLAVCGFGNTDFSAYTIPSITSVHVDGPEMGRLAARLIMDRCQGRPVDHSVVDLGFRLIERESTGG